MGCLSNERGLVVKHIVLHLEDRQVVAVEISVVLRICKDQQEQQLRVGEAGNAKLCYIIWRVL